jgi:hypothetical protein
LMSGLTMGLMSLDILNLEVLLKSGTKTQRKYAERIMPLVKRHHLLLVTLVCLVSYKHGQGSNLLTTVSVISQCRSYGSPSNILRAIGHRMASYYHICHAGTVFRRVRILRRFMHCHSFVERN